MTYNIDALKKVITDKGYTLFDSDTHGNYHLNIIGIRNDNAEANTFGDTICILYKDLHSVENLFCCVATTVPGKYWLNHPMNTRGTAIMKEGQYIGCWGKGLHKGIYSALVQVGNITVWRDTDLNSIATIGTKGEEQETGSNFNIELHHAGNYGAIGSIINDKWSAGCQVCSIENDQVHIMNLVDTSIGTGRPNLFSYTLLNTKDFN